MKQLTDGSETKYDLEKSPELYWWNFDSGHINPNLNQPRLSGRQSVRKGFESNGEATNLRSTFLKC